MSEFILGLSTLLRGSFGSCEWLIALVLGLPARFPNRVLIKFFASFFVWSRPNSSYICCQVSSLQSKASCKPQIFVRSRVSTCEAIPRPTYQVHRSPLGAPNGRVCFSGFPSKPQQEHCGCPVGFPKPLKNRVFTNSKTETSRPRPRFGACRRWAEDVADVEYVAWQADHDAYGFAGQKCSAQSMLFMHERLGI